MFGRKSARVPDKDAKNARVPGAQKWDGNVGGITGEQLSCGMAAVAELIGEDWNALGSV